MKIPAIIFLLSLLPTAAIGLTSISSYAQNLERQNRDIQDSVSREVSQATDSNWRRMTQEEATQFWEYILNSPLGIAALNQLAIEGFISPVCKKTFYVNEEFGGFQSLLRVKCREPQGVSIALAYDEIRVIFNRFESNIESFEFQRVSWQEMPPEIRLPD